MELKQQEGYAVRRVCAALGLSRSSYYHEQTSTDDLIEYEDLADARSQIGYFIEEVYQRKRIHAALGHLTPAEFEAAWVQEHTQATLLRSQEKVSSLKVLY